MQTRSKTARRPPIFQLSLTPTASPDPGEETGSTTQQSEYADTNDEYEDDQTPAPSAVEPARNPKRSKDSGYAAYTAQDREKDLRKARYQTQFENFLVDVKKRQERRKDLATRNRIWQEARDKAQARIEASDREREELLQTIDKLNAAREAHNRANAVAVSEAKDAETKKKWEAYFNVETDELDVEG